LPEVLILLVVLLLVVGAEKLPRLGEALGIGIRSSRKASRHRDRALDVTPRPQDAQGLSQSAADAAMQVSRAGRRTI
jgi:sec-independent protein translocase protein TatA